MESPDAILLQKIRYYQDGINRHIDSGNDKKILHYISKLYDMPITVAHLQETGIGRTVNALRKNSGNVGQASKAIVNKWKSMVAEEEEKAKTEEDEEEDEDDDSQSSPPPVIKKSQEELEIPNGSSNNNKSDKKHKKDKEKHHKSSHKDSHKHGDSSQKHSSSSSSSSKNRNEEKESRKRKHEEKERSSSKKHKDSNNEVTNVADEEMVSEKKHHKSKHHKKSSHRDEKKEKKSESKHSDHKKSKHKEDVTVPKIRKEHLEEDGIDSGSGASFAEALGMMEQPTTSTKSFRSQVPNTKKVKESSNKESSNKESKKSSKVSTSPTSSSLVPLPSIKLEPFDTEITTDYKPLSRNHYPSPPPQFRKPTLTEEEALSVVMSSKRERTKVYSGNKQHWGFVPSLFNMCIRVLQDNIDSLEYTGGVPYTILKPVLERANAQQLFVAEHHNSYLLDDTDELWEVHCKREFRTAKREEMESWRDMYMRCVDERESKLRALTANIKQNTIEKTLPVRQTKLAYVDSIVKPPRSVARKQAKFGTASSADKKPLVTPASRLNSIAASAAATGVSVPPPPQSRGPSSNAIKPKKAPLMQKTLALIKNRYRR